MVQFSKTVSQWTSACYYDDSSNICSTSYWICHYGLFFGGGLKGSKNLPNLATAREPISCKINKIIDENNPCIQLLGSLFKFILHYLGSYWSHRTFSSWTEQIRWRVFDSLRVIKAITWPVEYFKPPTQATIKEKGEWNNCGERSVAWLKEKNDDIVFKIV